MNLEDISKEHKVPYEEAFSMYVYQSSKLLKRDWPRLGSFMHVPQLTYNILDRYYRIEDRLNKYQNGREGVKK